VRLVCRIRAGDQPARFAGDPKAGSGSRSRGAAAGDGIVDGGPRRPCRRARALVSDTSSEECH